MTLVLLVTFLVLLLLDVPVVFCMLIASLAALLFNGDSPLLIGLEMSRAMASFYPFIAVPFFILAGDLMNEGGLSQRITDFMRALVGHRRGGMAMVTTLSSQMFGAVSGASSATCAAIGSVMIPVMERQGYSRPFATALAACSGTIGALIPPSLMLLVYGVISNTSIEKVFLGGVLPGIMLGVGLMAVSYRFARKQGIPVADKVSHAELFKSAYAAIFAIILVLIIFGGILGGIFTATEAAAVAVVYALLVGGMIYRRLTWKNLPKIFIGSAKTAAVLCFLTCAAVLFATVLALGHVPQTLAESLLGGCGRVVEALGRDLDPQTFALLRKVLVLLVINLSLLLIGMFVDGGPALLIVVPVLLPVAKEIGVDPVHFGVIVVCNLIIGLVTPPVGTTLFVASSVGGVKMSAMIPHVLRFLGVMIAVLMLVTFVPALSLWLPGFLD
jgi:C4-dicarboxylate transporter DctM subunit